MCGIAGIVHLDRKPVDPSALRRMCDAIAHRGPDDAGYVFLMPGAAESSEGCYWSEFTEIAFSRGNEHLPVMGGAYCRDEFARNRFSIGLGHRRLSIIDLTHRGHQPMPSADRRYWIAYNGEIYNYRELREGLEAKGHRFRTRSDTEVLLHLWEEHGSACLSQLNGMFAFAVYDRQRNTLALARDRFGVKPLYYAMVRETLVFGSEVKALLASGQVEHRIRPQSLVEYFTFQNLFGEETLFESIRLLSPGTVLEIPVTVGARPAVRRYHAGFPAVDTGLKDESAVRERVAEAFETAVRRQLVSDVEVGSYLSGGMDSGSIVAVAGRTIPRLLTFTAGFDLTHVDGIEQGFDERRLAEKLSFLLQTEHYDVVLHAGDMPAAMERISWHMDDPRVGMCHQNWYVAKLASRFVRVCLAGAGGDELFAGYPWRYRKGMQAGGAAEFDQAYFRYWHRLAEPEEVSTLFSPEIGAHRDWPWESFERVMAQAPVPQADLSPLDNLLQRALHFEFKTFLSGYLVTEDRISMAHGMETRVPFLDNDLADLAWKIPPSLKVRTEELGRREGNGHIDSADGKHVLRMAMEKYLPAEFTRQKKQGFSPPDENWYRGPSMDYIQSVLLDARTLSRPWFDRRQIESRLAEHFSGRRNHRLLIWSLLSFEWLQRHFVDGEVKSEK